VQAPEPTPVRTVTPGDADDALPAVSTATTRKAYSVSAVNPRTVTEFVVEVATTCSPR